MAEPDWAGAIRIVVEHVPMSADARHRVAIAIGDVEASPTPAPPAPDPRDAEIASLREQLAAAQTPVVASSGEAAPEADSLGGAVEDAAPMANPDEVPSIAEIST